MNRARTEAEQFGGAAMRGSSAGQPNALRYGGTRTDSPGIESPAASRRYMPGLDGLRAIAVLAVIVYHLDPDWAPGGLLGVGVFFVLSGYLITDILIAQWKSSGKIDLKDFWIRRVRRLLPLLLVMLGATDPARLPRLQGDVITSLLYVNNWWLIFRQVSYFESFGPLSPFGHLWSLAVEEQFYIAWPFLLWLGLRLVRRRGPLAGIIIAGAAVSAIAMALLYEPGADPSRVYYGTDTRAFALLIGAALAVVWPSWKLTAGASPRMRNTVDAAGASGLLVVMLMIWLTDQYDGFLYRGGMVLLSLASAAAVAALVHPASRLGSVLGSKPLRWLGVRSYGIYIWHYPVIVLTGNAPGADGVDFTQAALQVAASIGLAALSWRYFEQPIRSGAWIRSTTPTGRRRGLMSYSVAYMLLVLILAILGKNGPGNDVAAGPAAQAIRSAVSAVPAPSREEQRKESDSPKNGTDDPGAAIPVQATTVPADAGPGPVQVGGPVESTTTEPSPGTSETSEASAPAEPAARRPDTGLTVTAIGDSVILDAAPYLNKLLPGIVIDGKVGRQLAEGKEVTGKLLKDKKLGAVVIIELGTNGAFTKEQLGALLESIGNERKVVLVNTRVPRPWESNVNAALKDAADHYSNVTLVDWHSASAEKSTYFAADGVHLKEEGARFYASLVAKAIGVPPQGEAAAADNGAAAGASERTAS